MVVHWHLTFLRRGQVCFPIHLYGHHTFVWEKCWEFQTTSSLKPLVNVAQISCGASSYGASLGQGNERLLKEDALCWIFAQIIRNRSSTSRPRWLSWMRRPTGDQEVAGSTPAEVGNILSWRLIMKYFLRSFSPFRWFKKGIQEGQLSVSGERMCTILVNRLED